MPGLWVLVAAMLLFIALQIHTMAVAMRYYDNMYLQPVFQSFFLGSATLGGIVNFNELESLTALEIVLFLLGCSMLFLGVAVLSGRRQQGLSACSKWRAVTLSLRFVLRLQHIVQNRAVRVAQRTGQTIVQQSRKRIDVASSPAACLP